MTLLDFRTVTPAAPVAWRRPSLDTAFLPSFHPGSVSLYWLALHRFQALLPLSLLCACLCRTLFLRLWDWFITVRLCSRPCLSLDCGNSCAVAGTVSGPSPGSLCRERGANMSAERQRASGLEARCSRLLWWFRENLSCDSGDLGSTPGLGRSPGEGNGHSLQHSCLENPRDRRAWRATVHGVPESQTQVSKQHTCSGVQSP